MKLHWLIALAPVILGLAIAILLTSVVHTVPIVFARGDIATLALLAGLAASISIAAAFAVFEWIDRQKTILKEQVQSQSANERRRFLRRLDHELKNPLTAIRAGLANLSEAPGEAARQEALCSVEAQALRLSRLAADLRKLAELETRPVECSPVDMELLLQEAFSFAQDHIEADERRLTLSIPQAPWPLPKVSGDSDLLFLAIHNLLDNAIKFTRPGDTVEVRAFEDVASVVVEVADTGPGIPDDEMAHVWEELYRGKSARGVHGSGLGLALVRAIAERHNGQVNLRSRAGQGTVFSIKLPVG